MNSLDRCADSPPESRGCGTGEFDFPILVLEHLEDMFNAEGVIDIDICHAITSTIQEKC